MSRVHVCDRISRLSTIHDDVVVGLKLQSLLMDLCGDYVNACLPSLISLLYKALGHRVTLIAAKPIPDAKVNLSPAAVGSCHLDAVSNKQTSS